LMRKYRWFARSLLRGRAARVKIFEEISLRADQHLFAISSDRKIAANRQNSQRSTGPRTALDKKRIRRWFRPVFRARSRWWLRDRVGERPYSAAMRGTYVQYFIGRGAQTSAHVNAT
jgi:hypothetical protein